MGEKLKSKAVWFWAAFGFALVTIGWLCSNWILATIETMLMTLWSVLWPIIKVVLALVGLALMELWGEKIE